MTAAAGLRQDVTFRSGSVSLTGTLTLPDGDGPHPAVILISGSGAQDRDGRNPVLPHYRPLRSIADHLAGHGIAARNPDELAGRQADAEIAGMQSPWMRFFMAHDPRPDWERAPGHPRSTLSWGPVCTRSCWTSSRAGSAHASCAEARIVAMLTGTGSSPYSGSEKNQPVR